jgi:hypothetical protein
MPVKGIVTGIELATGEPPVKRGVGSIKYLIPLFMPRDGFSGLAPETFRVLYAFPESLIELAHQMPPQEFSKVNYLSINTSFYCS